MLALTLLVISVSLERVLIDRLPEGQALYPADYLTDQPERFLD